MARSRRVSRGTRRPREKADWVYRGGITDDTGIPDWFDATYASAYRSLGTSMTGPTSQGLILYDSQNWFVEKGGDVAAEFGYMNRASRAEGKRVKVRRVAGQFSVQASTWTLGSEIRLGLRIAVFHQDPTDGGILAPVSYRMMNDGNEINTGCNVWANSKQTNLWEFRHYLHFATGNETSLRTLKINVPVKWTLQPDQCLAFYLENAAGGAGLRYQCWLRTLVVDEG